MPEDHLAQVARLESLMIAGVAPNSDYWKIEGDKAIRVHLKARLRKFSPGMNTTQPGSRKLTDPVYHRLGQNRCTKLHFASDPGKEIVIDDNWHGIASDGSLPEQ